jgi:transposase-like protein
MNRRSGGDAQLALPGLAPLCPHCGARRTELTAPAEAGDGAVSGQHWECRACGRGFWSLPSLGSTRTNR